MDIFQAANHQVPNPTNKEKRLLRLKQIVPALIPISKASWWNGVKSGRYPKPIKLGERTTVWRSEDIDRLIAGGDSL